MERFNVFQRGLPASIASMVVVALTACGPADEFSQGFMQETSGLQEGIISGQRSKEGQYPTTGAILFTARDKHGAKTGSLMCSGTLIAPDVVLAAAHCNTTILRLPYKKVSYYFSLALDVSRFGEDDTRLPPQTTLVHRVVPHPLFDLANVQLGLGASHDIALFYLSAPITSVRPSALIQAADAGVLKPGAPVAIAGYGRRYLYETEEDAGIKYHGITAINRVAHTEMQVSRGDPQPHKCHGDSGGPTFMGIVPHNGGKPVMTLIGVTSHAFDNADCYHGGVDTRVDRYLDWIYADMNRACRDGRRPACR